MKAKYKMNILKIMLLILIITHFSCYITLAAEMGGSNYTKLTDNIVAWKNIDNADIVLANGQDISNLSTKKEIQIQEEEEEIIQQYDNLDLCLILDCSASMDQVINDVSRMTILKSATRNMIKSLSENFQLRVTIISFGIFISPVEIKWVERNGVIYPDAFFNPFSGGRILTNLESNLEKVLKVIDSLEPEGNTPTGEAIDFADTCWSNDIDKESLLRKTLLITDGTPYRISCACSRCNTKF